MFLLQEFEEESNGVPIGDNTSHSALKPSNVPEQSSESDSSSHKWAFLAQFG